MNFGQAIEAIKEGKRVARSGWNGKGMYIYLVRWSSIPTDHLRAEAKSAVGKQHTEETIIINSHIDMKAADGSIVVGWLASQTDMLSDDWEVVE